MKTIKNIILIILILILRQNGEAQGFLNLNFESANPSGHPPNSSDVPVTSAFPGWSVSYGTPGVGTNAASTVWYDGLSLGGAFVSVNDTNTGSGFVPLQGRYSAYLFGGLSSGGNPTYSTISQTGLVPNGTLSLLMDVKPWNGFSVSLGGQTINMVALQTFSSYTLYGGDISAFAGQSVQLSITAPPTSIPNGVLLDDIVFSPSSVPEPSTLALGALGTLLLGFRRWRQKATPCEAAVCFKS